MRVAIGFLLAFLRHLHGSDASGNQIVLGETRDGWSATLDPVLDVRLSAPRTTAYELQCH